MKSVKGRVGVYFKQSSSQRFRGKPDGTFYITYRCAGKYKWEKIGKRSDKVNAAYASQVRTERLQQLRTGHLPSSITGTDITFEEAFQRFKTTHLALSKHPENEINQERIYKKHLKERIGNKHLSKITPLELEDLKAELLRNYAPQTVTHVLGLVRQVYNKCVEWELWSGQLPTRNLKMPKADNSRVRFLSVEDADKLLADVRERSVNTYQIALLSLHTGMRANEIFTLRGEHVDLVNGQIRLSETKNYTSRTVYLTEEVKDELATLPIGPGRLVFPGRGGVLRKRISQAFPRSVKKLGLNDGLTDARDKIVFHSLRHTFASWLAIEGVPLYVISQLLGHRSLEMTSRYAHLCPDVHLQAVGKLESMIKHQRSSSPRDPSN
ncbi:MAG: tyrosine-type recombinase/integrase [Desulfovibrio sp.]